MRFLALRSLAGTAALLLPLIAGVAQAQDDCPHCLGAHGYSLHTTHLHHDPYGYGVSHYPRAHGLHGPHGEVGANWGDCTYRHYGQHDLFYNYWIGGYCGANTAPLYISPRPVPPHVGHTFITYQPLMPHEFMYKHHRTYHRYYDNGMGLTRTCVRYR